MNNGVFSNQPKPKAKIWPELHLQHTKNLVFISNQGKLNIIRSIQTKQKRPHL